MSQTKQKKGAAGGREAEATVIAFMNRYLLGAVLSAAAVIGLALFGRSTFGFLFIRLGLSASSATAAADGVVLGLFASASAFASIMSIAAFFDAKRRYPATLKLLIEAGAAPKKKKEPFRVELIRWVLSEDRFQDVVRFTESSLEKDVLFSGEFESPLIVAAQYTAYFIISLVALIPITITLFLLLRTPLVAAALAVPPLILFYPQLTYRNKKSDYSRAVEDELPFFAAVATIMSSAGLTIFATLQRVAHTTVFRAFRGEASVIERDVELFGLAPLDALDERARTHPNRMFSAFLSGYTSIVKSGGEVEAYLLQRVREYLDWLAFRWRQYAEKAASIGEMMLTMYFIVPVFLIFGGALVGSSLIFLLIPLPLIFAALLYSSISTSRPRYPDTVNAKLILPIAVGVGVAVPLILLVPSYSYAGVGFGLIAFAAALDVQTASQVKSINEVEESLPVFIREITEYRKVGYDLLKSLTKTSRDADNNKAYKPGFKVVLQDFVGQISLGRTVGQAVAKTGSWLGRFVFFSVQALAEAGNVTPALLEQLGEFTHRFVEAKRQTRASIRLFKMLGIMMPILLSISTLITVFMLQSFATSGLGSAAGTPFGTTTGFNLQLTPLEQAVIYIFIVTSSFSVGLVIDKATEGTILSPTTSIIATAIAIAAVAGFAHLQPLLNQTLGSSL